MRLLQWWHNQQEIATDGVCRISEIKSLSVDGPYVMTEPNFKLKHLTIQMGALLLAIEVNSEREAIVVSGRLLQQLLVS